MRYAITGSIGTGKSTVANAFKKRGFKVLDADKMVHELYQDKAVLSKVEALFPEAFINHKMNKDVIANVIFSNQEKKKELENLIHPLVKEQILALDDVVIEVPLLYESNMQSLFNKVIVVYCTKDEQLKRLMIRNNITLDEAKKRINSQMDIEEKKKLGDFVVDNSGDIKNINKQVDDIIKKL